MAVPLSSASLEWIKLAEEYIRKGDHESAAGHLWRVAHYFRLNKDMEKFREYIRKTGDCYLHAAEKLCDSDQHKEASILYIKAAARYKEVGDYSSAERCNLKLHECYEMIAKDGLINFHGSSLDLKNIGDHFRGENEIDKARECYEAAAEKAENERKLILAGGLLKDAGDCSWSIGNVEKAADNYARAADNYFKAEEYFEAAWHYNISGFLLISLEKFDEASLMAKRAKNACLSGDISVLLNSLSEICELLSRRSYYAAEEEWGKIKRKFKKSYADLVDLCLVKVRSRAS